MMRVVAMFASQPAKDAGFGRVLSRADQGAMLLAARVHEQAFAMVPVGDEAAMNFALAAGAADAQSLDESELPEFDVVFVGPGAAPIAADLFPAQLAEARGAALVFDVLEASRQGAELQVVRAAGRGATDVLAVQLPAVLVVSADIPRLGYVSRSRLQAAARLRAVRATQSDDRPGSEQQTSEVSWLPLRPRVKRAASASKTQGEAGARADRAFGLASDAASSRTASHVIQADAATCAAQLLRYLRHHGFVAPHPDGDASSATNAANAADSVLHPPDHSNSSRLEAPSLLPATLARSPRPLSAAPLGTASPGMARRPRKVERDA